MCFPVYELFRNSFVYSNLFIYFVFFFFGGGGCLNLFHNLHPVIVNTSKEI